MVLRSTQAHLQGLAAAPPGQMPTGFACLNEGEATKALGVKDHEQAG